MADERVAEVRHLRASSCGLPAFAITFEEMSIVGWRSDSLDLVGSELRRPRPLSVDAAACCRRLCRLSSLAASLPPAHCCSSMLRRQRLPVRATACDSENLFQRKAAICP